MTFEPYIARQERSYISVGVLKIARSPMFDRPERISAARNAMGEVSRLDPRKTIGRVLTQLKVARSRSA